MGCSRSVEDAEIAVRKGASARRQSSHVRNGGAGGTWKRPAPTCCAQTEFQTEFLGEGTKPMYYKRMNA